jgi:hypothetical protein
MLQESRCGGILEQAEMIIHLAKIIRFFGKMAGVSSL